MTKEEKVCLIDAAIAMRIAGYSLEEIAKTLNVEEAVIKALDSKLEIVHF